MYKTSVLIKRVSINNAVMTSMTDSRSTDAPFRWDHLIYQNKTAEHSGVKSLNYQ